MFGRGGDRVLSSAVAVFQSLGDSAHGTSGTVRDRDNRTRAAALWCLSHVRSIREICTRAAMTERNRNFGAALGIVVVLVVLAAIAATFAP